MEHLVFAVMQRASADVRPLPSYAVVDLGFDAVWQDGRPPGRATALVRRAATRPRCQWDRTAQSLAMARTLLRVELLLRSGGLSASVCGDRASAPDRRRAPSAHLPRRRRASDSRCAKGRSFRDTGLRGRPRPACRRRERAGYKRIDRGAAARPCDGLRTIPVSGQVRCAFICVDRRRLPKHEWPLPSSRTTRCPMPAVSRGRAGET